MNQVKCEILMVLKNFIILMTFFFGPINFSWGQITPLFGPEFTFTNQELIMAAKIKGNAVTDTEENVQKRDEMLEVVKRKCPHCQVEKLIDKNDNIQYRVHHSDSLWFDISLDPGVIEVQMKPLSLNQIIKHQSIIQDLIFNSAHEAGINPHISAGGGHIHLDLQSSFNDNWLLFLNFITDYQNHPGVGMGALNRDPKNAPVFAILPESEQRDYYDLILEECTVRDEIKYIGRLSKEINKAVYFESFEPRSPSAKYQAINLLRITDYHIPQESKTIEIRAIRPQQNVEEYIKEVQLFQNRLNYLAQFKSLLPYKNQKVTLWSEEYKQQVVDDFYQYVTESGLLWDDYKGLLSKQFKNFQPSK